MDVDECITAYGDLATEVFSEPRRRKMPNMLKSLNKIQARFDLAKLGSAIRKMAARSGASGTESLNNEVKRGCRT